MSAIHVAAAGAESLIAMEAIMGGAFDPRFGEAWTKAQCLGVLTLPGYALRGAWIGGGDSNRGGAVLAGFSIVRWVADESELLLLAVAPQHQRRGVGRALMDDWLALAATKGAARLFLEMRYNNSARFLYEAFGFTGTSVRKNYYRGNDGQMRDAVTIHRNLP